MENNTKIFYKEWLSEKRDGYDLIVFAYIKESFLTERNVELSYVENSTLEQMILELAKKKEMGKYFHREDGPAYGAAYKDHKTGELDVKHTEYWINGERQLNENMIKKINEKGKK